MADWSIKIVPATTGSGAAFQPDIQGYKHRGMMTIVEVAPVRTPYSPQ